MKTKRHALIIDDDPSLIFGMKMMLENEGFKVTKASTGDEALKHINRDIEIIITDFSMPGMSGIDFLKAIKKRYPMIPIIVYSGLREVKDQSLKFGADSFIEKPFRPEKMLEIVNKLLKKSF